MKKLIVGNWKLNLDHLEAIQLLQKINYSLPDGIETSIDIVIAPSHTSLRSIQTVIDADNLSIQLSAQDVSAFDNGAFTGEVSSYQLKKLNVTWCIIGHSERRQNFDETDEIINKKLSLLLNSEIKPIICIGETQDQRNAGKQVDVCLKQVQEIFKNIRKDRLHDVAIAYEPVWAIGTGVNADPEDTKEVVKEVIDYLDSKSFDIDKFRFLYGGSISPDNTEMYINDDNFSGLLVGGNSIVPDKFVEILLKSK
tara:strand:+ start:438 stop:1196 length:759 start_codon:yes stop_codon:yes gene_type:complete